MSKDIRIVVLQRGWIVVGVYDKDGSQCSIDHGYVIERWGTTEGLGQLALEGVKDATRLRKIPKVEFHELTTIMSIKCNSEKWNSLC